MIERQITPEASPSNSSDSASNSPTLSPPLVLLLWLVAQLAAIASAILRVPLWAPPVAMELYSLQFLLVAQYVISALTFPWLLRSRRSVISRRRDRMGIPISGGNALPGPNRARRFTRPCTWESGSLPSQSGDSHFPHQNRFMAVAIVSTWICGGPVVPFPQSGIQFVPARPSGFLPKSLWPAARQLLDFRRKTPARLCDISSCPRDFCRTYGDRAVTSTRKTSGKGGG